ncbi:phosphotransferase family protein [Bradyrhizobium sp. NAS80.1]|uniref:phosphotransferase family protein n=1 Tax=Bradyrhizobium sp. NAS80.1 TaxID=1680159 RepID=UPI0024BF5B7F|nr:phosphotransferase family protein [Bradyrhizobium sp. NAS80.1]
MCCGRSRRGSCLNRRIHAIDREYRIISALSGTGVPVPRVYLYCEDQAIAGAEFYIMDFLDGRVLVDPSLPNLDRDQRASIYAEMNRFVAELHQVDYKTVGLGDYGRTGSYFARQIARWTRQARDSGMEDIPALEALMEWLPEHVPPGDETSLVHGDYRLDNLVFDKKELRAIGALDWELSTLGHPLADFSYNCLGWHIPAALWRGMAGLDVVSLSIPDEKSYYVNTLRRPAGERSLGLLSRL